VLLTGVTLMLEICAVNPESIERYRRPTSLRQLCKVLRSLLMSGFAPEHDVGGITDPFLQVKVRVRDACAGFCLSARRGRPCCQLGSSSMATRWSARGTWSSRGIQFSVPEDTTDGCGQPAMLRKP
jgi:hypothetical protein